MAADQNVEDAQKLLRDGYLIATVDSVVAAEIQSVLASGRRFFALPEAAKLLNRMEFDCGYRPGGIEFSKSSSCPDSVESFSASARTCEADLQLGSSPALDLHMNMTALFKHLEKIAESLTTGCARLFSPRALPHSFEGKFNQWSQLQINSALPTDGTEFTNEQHEDGHLLTIACATAAGLEISHPIGCFVPLHIAPPKVIVMPGQAIALMSGGAIKPLYHRVRRVIDHERRMSVMFFADIAPDDCLPWIRNTFNEGTDIGEHVLTNSARFGLGGFSRIPRLG
jgi:isopenicillin N synthase-like dioxygenase